MVAENPNCIIAMRNLQEQNCGAPLSTLLEAYYIESLDWWANQFYDKMASL